MYDARNDLHLNDDQWLEFLETPESGATGHLRVCDSCRTEFESLREAVAAAAGTGRTRDESFWAAQRARIFARIAARQRSGIRWKWAAAAATVALAAFGMAQEGSSPPPSTFAGHPKLDEDDLLLMDVARTVRRPVPRALGPANLLAAEMHKAWNQQNQDSSKKGERP